MNRTQLHQTPSWKTVWTQQLQATSLTMRSPVTIALFATVVGTLLIVTTAWRVGEPIQFHPERTMFPSLIGLLLPLHFWRGGKQFGANLLWTLPINRIAHALAKVLAGWIWLTVILCLYFVWLALLTFVTGGEFIAQEIIYLPFDFPGIQQDSPSAVVEQIAFTAPTIFWVTPFTASSTVYLAATAMLLGFKNPLRWSAGLILIIVFLNLVSGAAQIDWLQTLFANIFAGPIGLDTLLTAGTEAVQYSTHLPNGDQVIAWRKLPDPAKWLQATGIWIVIASAGFTLALSRHRES